MGNFNPHEFTAISFIIQLDSGLYTAVNQIKQLVLCRF
jgi:hypothetical protein